MFAEADVPDSDAVLTEDDIKVSRPASSSGMP